MQTGPKGECRGNFFISDGKVNRSGLFDENILVTGISVYEVIKVKEKVPLFFEDHLARLFNSAAVAGAGKLPQGPLIEKSIKLLISKNPEIIEGNIRILLHFHGSLDQMPSLYCYFIPHYYPSREEYELGVPVILLEAERRFLHSKIINLEFRAKINQEIKNKNAYEAFLTDSNGYVTEGSKSNYFVIKNQSIFTSPGTDVLPGITRKNILDICLKSGISAEEKKIHLNDLKDFDSCFISGTSPGILPVRNIEATFFNVGHPLLKLLSLEYKKLTDNYILKNNYTAISNNKKKNA
jgi:branched-chain amino acid aminotransferase